MTEEEFEDKLATVVDKQHEIKDIRSEIRELARELSYEKEIIGGKLRDYEILDFFDEESDISLKRLREYYGIGVETEEEDEE